MPNLDNLTDEDIFVISAALTAQGRLLRERIADPDYGSAAKAFWQVHLDANARAASKVKDAALAAARRQRV